MKLKDDISKYLTKVGTVGDLEALRPIHAAVTELGKLKNYLKARLVNSGNLEKALGDIQLSLNKLEMGAVKGQKKLASYASVTAAATCLESPVEEKSESKKGGENKPYSSYTQPQGTRYYLEY